MDRYWKIGCAAIIVAIPLGVFLRGVAITHLWTWFVVPLGLPSISMAWALGISTIVALLTNHSGTTPGDSEYMPLVRAISFAVLGPLAYLAGGYIISLWM